MKNGKDTGEVPAFDDEELDAEIQRRREAITVACNPISRDLGELAATLATLSEQYLEHSRSARSLDSSGQALVLPDVVRLLEPLHGLVFHKLMLYRKLVER